MLDPRLDVRARSLQRHGAAACRLDHSRAEREAVLDGRTEAFCVEEDRRAVELAVGRVETGAGTDEATGLGDVRGKRAAALGLEQLYVLRRQRRHQRLVVGLPVHQRHAVVLQALADGEVLPDLDLEQRQRLGRTDARQHQ